MSTIHEISQTDIAFWAWLAERQGIEVTGTTWAPKPSHKRLQMTEAEFADHLEFQLLFCSTPKKMKHLCCEFILSQADSTGNEPVVLSPELCQQFSTLDPAVTWADYHQPFPTTVVTLPREYTQSRPFAGHYPERIILHHEEAQQRAFIVLEMKDRSAAFTIECHPEQAISDVLDDVLKMKSTRVPKKNRQAQQYLYIAVNSMLAMNTKPAENNPLTDG